MANQVSFLAAFTMCVLAPQIASPAVTGLVAEWVCAAGHLTSAPDLKRDV